MTKVNLRKTLGIKAKNRLSQEGSLRLRQTGIHKIQPTDSYVGGLIRAYRLSKNMSLSDLAQILKCSTHTIARREQDGVYTLEQVAVISKYLNIPIQMLITAALQDVDTKLIAGLDSVKVKKDTDPKALTHEFSITISAPDTESVNSISTIMKASGWE